jgi:hypothetical protein
MAKRKAAKKKSKATPKPAKKSVPRAGKKAAGKPRRAATKSSVAALPKEWTGGRIVIKKPPATALKGRGAERVQAGDIRDSRGRPIPKKVFDWFVKKLDAAHKVSVRIDDSYDAPKVPHVSPEAAQLLRENAATWASLAEAERDDARAREQESLDSLAKIAAPKEFQDGKVVLAKPKKPVAEAHCWKPDFEGEVYQAVLHYYSYLPPDHVGSITDPKGYPAKAMSPEAAQLYRDHRRFWEAKHAESKAQSKSAKATRKKVAEAITEKAAASAGISRADLEAKLDRLAGLVEKDKLQMVADMLAAFGDAWLYEALLAGSAVEPDGTLKPGKILKRFKKRADLILVLAVAAMPDGLSLDPSLRRDTAMKIAVNLDAMDIVADISSRLPNLMPRLNGLHELEELSPPVAELIAKAASDVWLKIKKLSAGEAASLAKLQAKMDLGDLEAIDSDVAAALARHEGTLELGIKELPGGIATCLAEHRGHLSFPNLVAISKTAVAALEKHVGILGLGSDARLDTDVAQHLARHAGPVSLPDVLQIDPQVAEALAEQRHGLQLRGIKELPSGLCGVRLCERLVAFPSEDLCLFDLVSLSADCASALAVFKGPLDLAVKTWSEESLIAIAQHQGKLKINPSSISDKVAAALSQRGPSTSLTISITSLSDEAAASLRSYQGELFFDEPCEMSPAAAKHLSERHSFGLRRSNLSQSIQKIFDSAGTWHKGRLDPDAYWEAESLCLWTRGHASDPKK